METQKFNSNTAQGNYDYNTTYLTYLTCFKCGTSYPSGNVHFCPTGFAPNPPIYSPAPTPEQQILERIARALEKLVEKTQGLSSQS